MGIKDRLLIDADVLFSRTLRDWFLMLSSAPGEPFDVYWTEDLLAETIARIRDRRPDINSGALETFADRLRSRWELTQIRSFPPARDTFIGNDEGDLHVHSAAVAGQIDIVVTNDSTGLLPAPGSDHSPDELPYEVWAADDYLHLVAVQNRTAVTFVAIEQIRYYRRERGQQDINLVERLEKAEAPKFANDVRWFLQTCDLTRC